MFFITHFSLQFVEKITFRGITGLVGFDQSGFRSSFALDVMTISTDGLQKVSRNNKSRVIRYTFFIINNVLEIFI
jgi:hypothetical protein